MTFSVYNPNDTWPCRLFDTLQLAFVSEGLYCYMVTNYANPEALQRATWLVRHCHRDCFSNLESFAPG